MNLSRRKYLQASAGLMFSNNLLGKSIPKFRTLIIIELAGGNDGLNTVIPISDPTYLKLRPTLALEKEKTIELNSTTALHQALADLLPAWNAGELAIVEGLGYENPNRSHFRSADIWATASDAATVKRSGWIHDALLDHNSDKKLAALILGGRDKSVRGGKINVVSTQSLAELRKAKLSEYLGQSGDVSEWIKRTSEITRKYIHHLPHPESAKQKLYPANKFAQRAQEATHLIKANVAPPVIGIHLRGFDTHANQKGRHHTLLKQLSSTIAAIRNDLSDSGHWQDTLIMTVSEFGRRAAENGSAGTDHGTAAPQFLIGGRVNGGLHGAPVNLKTMQNNDLEYKIDFRSMYASVLQQWLHVDNSPLLHHENFKALPSLIRT